MLIIQEKGMEIISSEKLPITPYSAERPKAPPYVSSAQRQVYSIFAFVYGWPIMQFLPSVSLQSAAEQVLN